METVYLTDRGQKMHYQKDKDGYYSLYFDCEDNQGKTATQFIARYEHKRTMLSEIRSNRVYLYSGLKCALETPENSEIRKDAYEVIHGNRDHFITDSEALFLLECARINASNIITTVNGTSIVEVSQEPGRGSVTL